MTRARFDPGDAESKDLTPPRLYKPQRVGVSAHGMVSSQHYRANAENHSPSTLVQEYRHFYICNCAKRDDHDKVRHTGSHAGFYKFTASANALARKSGAEPANESD